MEVVRVNVNILRWILASGLSSSLCVPDAFCQLFPHISFFLSFLPALFIHFLPLLGIFLSILYAYDTPTLLEMVSNCFSFVLISVKCNKNISIPEITIYVGRHTSWVEEARDDRISLSSPSKVFLGHGCPQESLFIFRSLLHSSQPCSNPGSKLTFPLPKHRLLFVRASRAGEIHQTALLRGIPMWGVPCKSTASRAGAPTAAAV